ncbi:MAG TPA: glutathione S-transferase N-terminal domain-containing protein [Burkholderiales bacterium]|nr:glutathione S-transferase N-terminal domain-containing protein [Burkholderiales bacterium]
MIDLYLAATANGLRAAVGLSECGLEYRSHKIDLMKGEQKTPEFLKLNPAAQIPVMVDHEGPNGKEITLAQSGAIILYAAEKTGQFLPQDLERRAKVLQWFMQGATDVSPTSGAIFQLEMMAPEKNEAITNHFKKRLLNFFALCDAHLANREFLADEISIADFMLYPNYFARKALIDAAGSYTNLHRWGATMGARPAVRKGMNPFG